MGNLLRASAYVALGSLASALLGTVVLPQSSPVAATGAQESFSPALHRRLENATTPSGDIQLVLAWNDGSKLRLSCVGPSGQELAAEAPSAAQDSIVHLSWPSGSATAGRYQVFVAREPASKLPQGTGFTLGIKGTQVREISGTLGPDDTKQLVYEFRHGGVAIGRSHLLSSALWTALVAAGAAVGLFLGQHPPAPSWRSQVIGVLAMLGAGLLLGAGMESLRPRMPLDPPWVSAVLWGSTWALLGGLLARVAGLATGRAVVCGLLGGTLGALAFEAAHNFFADPAANLLTALGQGLGLGAAFALAGLARPGAAQLAGQATGFSLRLASGVELPLTDELCLTESDLPPSQARFWTRTVAKVSTRPDAPHIYGLTNLSRSDWLVSLPGAAPAQVTPGQTVRLTSGTQIDFGTNRAELVASATG